MQEFLVKTINRAGGRGFVLFLGFLALSVYCVWLLSADARQQLNKMATAPGDNLQWTLAQLEVEFGAMRTAILIADTEDPTSLQEIRRRFDILYSRVAIINSVRAFEPVRSDPGVRDALERVTGFLQEFVPVIDSSDEVLAASLPEFLRRANEIRADVRMTTLVGVKVYSVVSEENRERAAGAMFDLAMLILFLVLLLLGLVVILAYVLAITRRQTDEIEQTRSRLGAIVGTSQDAVVVVDRNSRIIEFNAAAERIFGYSREEAMRGDMAEMIIPPHRREAHREGMKRHLETGAKRMIDSGLVEMEAMRKNGDIFPIELSISTARSAEGTIYISFVRDISDRIASEKELVEARDRAVLGERAKADLLAVMSHEMRTPLNGMLGTLDILEATDLDDRQRHFLEVMETSGQMLLRHVNDVLDVSRLDADTAEPSPVPFDLAGLVQAVAESLKSQAGARGNRLDVRVLGAIPPLVMGDRGRIEQVLVNLVGNACKFTENGRVTVEVEPSPGSDVIELRVIDTGIGIAEGDLERIFDDFVTLDASYARSSSGTGLGLGISRRLVRMLGGEIGVESEEGEGSAFWVRLPLPPVKASVRVTPPEPLSMQPDAGGRRVLLVEDNEVNRLVAREMLLVMGCSVTEALDGCEGVTIAGNQRFDLILMDISMPRLDGVSATLQLRSGDGPNSKTPIVALTAHALPEDIAKFRDAGFCDVMVKPLSRKRLSEVLLGRFGAVPACETGARAADELEETLGLEAAARVRESAVSEIIATIDEMDNRLRSGAPHGDLAAHAHRMAGLSGLVGLGEAHQGLARLQDALAAPDDTDIRALLQWIRSRLDEPRDVA